MRIGLAVSVASVAIAVLFVSASMAIPAVAQTHGTCVPVSERNGREFGCFITAQEILSRLPEVPVYWHIDAFPSRAAAEAAKGANGTVVESLGRIWLFTIAGADWRPSGGNAMANIGPLPLVKADQITATYMEGVFQPGMSSEIHRHPGTETWYTLEGEMCVETPEGSQVQRAGGPNVIVPAGLPMELIGIGSSVRRSLVLILQDASQPRSVHASDWRPKGLCK
jgi:quercetin dioxygenase-like cupin family protein